MKLLLIEDEAKLVGALSYLLRKNGYLVDSATDGETGFQLACTGTYDIIILDRMLPSLDGLSLLKKFRSLGHETPVLFLTAKDLPEERAEGLIAGADDYLGIPFSVAELLARLQALARRKGRSLEENILIVDDLEFDPRKSQVTKGNAVIKLTLKESQFGTSGNHEEAFAGDRNIGSDSSRLRTAGVHIGIRAGDSHSETDLNRIGTACAPTGA